VRRKRRLFVYLFERAPKQRPRPVLATARGPDSCDPTLHTFGDGQSGRLCPRYLRLDNMCRLTRDPVSSTAEQFLRDWLRDSCEDSAPGTTPQQILTRFR